MRDLGFVLNRQGGSARSNGSGLLRTDTLQSIVSETAKNATPSQSQQSASSKRASSPEHRRREESRDYPSKRARASSPSRGRDRDRWESGSGSHRRHGSPTWERDRDRDGPSSRRFNREEREEDKGVHLPSVLNMFISTLPAPSTFDGLSISNPASSA